MSVIYDNRVINISVLVLVKIFIIAHLTWITFRPTHHRTLNTEDKTDDDKDATNQLTSDVNS